MLKLQREKWDNECTCYGCRNRSYLVIDLGCLVLRLCEEHLNLLKSGVEKLGTNK